MPDEQVSVLDPLDPSAPSAPSTPDVAVPPTATPEPPAAAVPDEPQFQSIRDAAGGYDYDLSSYENDEDAFRHLIDRSRDYDRQQETIKNYESLLQQQAAAPVAPAAPPQPQATDAPPWGWNPPPYNPAWQSQVERNADTGALQPTNGGTLGTVNQLQTFHDYRANHMDRFWTEGPHKYMDPYLDQREQAHQEAIYEKVQEMIDFTLGGHRAQNEADKFLAENKWVYEHDANDQIVRNTITGENELSLDGKMFAKFMTEAEQEGFPQSAQQKYAMNMLEAHRVITGQKGAVPAGDKKKTDFLQQAAGYAPSAAGSETNRTPDASGVVPPQNPNMSLEEMLAQNLKSEGITDADIANMDLAGKY